MILYLLWLMRKTWNNTIWLLFKKKKTRSNNIKINQEKNLYYSSFEIYIISFQKTINPETSHLPYTSYSPRDHSKLLPAFINQTTSDPKHRPTSPIKFHSNGIHTPPRLFPSASDTNRPPDDDQRVEKIRGAAAEREKPGWKLADSLEQRAKLKKKNEKEEKGRKERKEGRGEAKIERVLRWECLMAERCCSLVRSMSTASLVPFWPADSTLRVWLTVAG